MRQICIKHGIIYGQKTSEDQKCFQCCFVLYFSLAYCPHPLPTPGVLNPYCKRFRSPGIDSARLGIDSWIPLKSLTNTGSERVVMNSWSPMEEGLNRLVPKEIRSRRRGISTKWFKTSYAPPLGLLDCRLFGPPPPPPPPPVYKSRPAASTVQHWAWLWGPWLHAGVPTPHVSYGMKSVHRQGGVNHCLVRMAFWNL